jgi:predicted AlkP superfamily phosphohydrolase/phosphomutase
VVIASALAMAATLALGAASSDGRHGQEHAAKAQKFVFFASDGMRQDLIGKYLDKKSTLGRFLKKGVRASGDGLLTQAPPNTGAGWYSLATGAWPGVHGSINNTFHINGQNFGSSTSFSTPGILKAESIAQSAERAGSRAC